MKLVKQAWLCAAVRNGFVIIWIHFGQHFYIINVIYARVNYTHAIDLTGGKCYFYIYKSCGRSVRDNRKGVSPLYPCVVWLNVFKMSGGGSMDL